MKHFTTFIFIVFAFFFINTINAQNISEYTLEKLVQTKRVASVDVSPDGKHIAYTVSVPREVYVEDDGKPYIELHVATPKGKSRKFITGKQTIASVSWGPNSKNIYFIAKRNQDKEAGIYRIAIDGGEAEKIVSASNSISAYSVNFDASELIYLMKEKNKSKEKLEKKGFKAKIYEETVKKNIAYRVDLKDSSKKHTKLNIEDNILSLGYHPRKNLLLVRATPTALIDDTYVASSYGLYDINGKLTESFSSEGKLGAASWSPDGEQVAFIGAEDKHDPAAGRLFVGETKTGKVTEVVKNYQGHVKDINWVSNYQLAFLGHVGTKSELSIVNMDSQAISVKVPVGDAVISRFDASSDGKILSGIASSDSYPSEVVNLSSNKLVRLTKTNNWINEKNLPKQETISYVARDGLTIEGILVYPKNYKKNRRYPLIMMVHGGPESHVSDAWLDRYSYPIKHASEKGFAVFLPNYRGSTGRGVDFSKLGQADYAGAEFNDLVDAIAHLSSMGLVDKERVGITGGSYGGYASAWAATALSEHFAASVMFVGISNQLSKFGTTDIPKEMYNVHARNYPWDKWQWMLERSPIYHTDKAKTPILIMHGEEDTRVHPSQSMELYRYIKTRTKTPVRLVFYPGEGHGNRKSASQLDYAQRLMRWMEFYLKGKKKGNKLPIYELDHDKKVEQDKSAVLK